jgi:hypothetical protein
LGPCLAGQAQSCGAISKFPLGYTLNSWLLIEAARHAIKIPVFLAALNSLVLALPLLLLRFSPSSQDLFKGWGLYMGLWLLTPIPRFYLFTGSLEVQAGVVTGLAIVLTVRALLARDGQGWRTQGPSRRAILICNGLWFIACLYKDTAVITFALAGLLLLVPDHAWRGLAGQGMGRLHRGGREKAMTAQGRAKSFLLSKHQFGALWLTLPGPIAALLAEGGFNLMRYRSLLPEAYLNEARLTSTPAFFRLQSLFWSVASPNGGLMVFWGLCFAVLGLFGLRRIQRDRRQFIAIKAAILWALISMVGLSLWWNPFGWESWGHRLMVPAMVAIVIATWEVLTSPGPLLALPAQGASLAELPSQAGPSQRKPLPQLALLASYLLVSMLVVVSLPYVSLGYRANGMDVRHHPAPALRHCAKMMGLLNRIPVERHLADVYSSELWRQCALESYRHNPSLAR